MAENIRRVRERMVAAARRAGRRADEVVLVAVTKTVEPERIDEAVAAGLTVFGESKVQEARAKIPLVSSRAHWHLVGHLQTNKAREAVTLFEMVHAVDSVKLAVELDRRAADAGRTLPVLLEVNVSGEASKFGLKPEELEAALEPINGLRRLELQGLITIPPFDENVESARPYFRRLRELRDDAARRQGLA